MKKIFCFSVWWFLFIACSGSKKEQDITIIFPGYKEPWPKATPESQGFSSMALEEARAQMTSDEDKEFTYMNMIVLRNGYDVWHIGNPYELPKTVKIQKDWASCGRSLMTTMFGMYFKENNVNLEIMDQPVNDAFISYTARDMDSAILVKHLLSYTACANPPGSSWNYACHYFTMHSIIRDQDGMNPSVRLKKLANLLDADWEPFEYWGHGLSTPFLTITATESEAARWGWLWINKGNWRGYQIVDEEFVNYSVRPIESPLGGYAHSNEGLQIHLNHNGMWGDDIPKDAYAAFGAGGKVIFVVPSLNLVCASTTHPSPYVRKMVGDESHLNIEKLYGPIVRAIFDP